MLDQEAAFATDVPSDIYAFHRYTGNSASLFRTLAFAVSNAIPRLSPGISHPTYETVYARFTPSNSD